MLLQDLESHIKPLQAWKKKTLHSIQYALYICVVEPVLAAVAHIAVVSDMEKKRGRERHRGNNILCLM